MTSKECWFCQKKQAFANVFCDTCLRPLDKEKLSDAVKVSEKRKELEELSLDPKLMMLLRKLAVLGCWKGWVEHKIYIVYLNVGNSIPTKR